MYALFPQRTMIQLLMFSDNPIFATLITVVFIETALDTFDNVVSYDYFKIICINDDNENIDMYLYDDSNCEDIHQVW